MLMLSLRCFDTQVLDALRLNRVGDARQIYVMSHFLPVPCAGTRLRLSYECALVGKVDTVFHLADKCARHPYRFRGRGGLASLS